MNKFVLYLLLAVVVIALIIASVWVVAKLLQWSWNGFVAPTFGVGTISFRQAVMLYVALWLVGGMFRVTVSRLT